MPGNLASLLRRPKKSHHLGRIHLDARHWSLHQSSKRPTTRACRGYIFPTAGKLPSRHGFDVSTSLLYIIIAASTSIDQHLQPSRITKKLASSKRLTTRACRGYIHILPGSGKLPSRHGFDGPSAIGHHHRSFDVNQLISICNRLASRRIWPGAPTVQYYPSSIGPLSLAPLLNRLVDLFV